MMKKALVFLALVILPVLACSQSRYDSPQTVSWDGDASQHEVAIALCNGDEIISLGITAELEYLVDLESLGYYGLYAVLVRGVEFTEPDMYDYSEWIRSDNTEDVIEIDGVYQTFYIQNAKPAAVPLMLRIKE